MATLKEILERAEQEKPDAFSNPVKARWLTELEGKIALDCFHMSPKEAQTVLYGWPKDENKVLLVRFPNEEIYSLYLEAMIDFHNGEPDRYQNTMERFNQAFLGFKQWLLMTFDDNPQGYLEMFREEDAE